MDLKLIIFTVYILIGILLIIFNKHASEISYNLVLYYTEKKKLTEVFLFKVDDENRNSMFFLVRTFMITFGILILSGSLYSLYFIK